MKPVKPIVIAKEVVFAIEKPRFNAHQTGTGAHRSKKVYSRKQKHSGQEY